MKKQSRSKAHLLHHSSIRKKPLVKSRVVHSRIKKTKKVLVKHVIKRNPQKVAIKRKIRATRPLHKKFVLHPVTILIILFVSIFVIDWTYKSIADNYSITATIAASALTEGAVITSPTNGQTFTTSTQSVDGTCPINSYVVLKDNGLQTGMDDCRVGNTFHFDVALFQGDNVLSAQDYNVTDQPGPTASSVTVNFTPPTPPPPPVTPPTTPSTPTPPTINATTSNTSDAPPLVLDTDLQYSTQTTNTQFTWQVEIKGGQPPYVITVNWGDGTTTTYTFTTDPIFTISHEYKTQGYYPIKIVSLDASHQERILQLATIVHKPGTRVIGPLVTGGGSNQNSPPSGATTTNGTSGGVKKKGNSITKALTQFEVSSKNWLWIAWPSLIVVSLMALSFWLGERQEKRVLYQRLHQVRKQRRAHT